MTPNETLATIEARAWQAEQERQRDLWLAWHIAALSRAKRLPSLKRLLGSGETRVLTGADLERRHQERREIMEQVDLDKLNEALKKR